MSNKLKDLIDIIQFKLKLSQEEIAERIGYSRPYLTNAIKKDTGGKVLTAIQNEFAEILQNETKEYIKKEPSREESKAALLALIENNKQLIENTRTLVLANLDLAAANLKLVSRDTNSENHSHISQVLQPYLALLAAGLASKYGLSEHDVDKEIGRILTDTAMTGNKLRN